MWNICYHKIATGWPCYSVTEINFPFILRYKFLFTLMDIYSVLLLIYPSFDSRTNINKYVSLDNHTSLNCSPCNLSDQLGHRSNLLKNLSAKWANTEFSYSFIHSFYLANSWFNFSWILITCRPTIRLILSDGTENRVLISKFVCIYVHILGWVDTLKDIQSKLSSPWLFILWITFFYLFSIF